MPGVRLFCVVLAAIVLAGCAGSHVYREPTTTPGPRDYGATIAAPMEDAWQRVVSNAAKSFFVVNNIDRSSGFINLSFSGDPTLIVDCGEVEGFVQNARGRRDYRFQAAAQRVSYEFFDELGFLIAADRAMTLNARVNIILRPESPASTSLTATFRYVLTRRQDLRQAGTYASRTIEDTVTFSPGDTAVLGAQQTAITCISSGKAERALVEQLVR